MVTFTSSLLLPYQVGSDRPCDSPEVWCDFVDLLDVSLHGIDLDIGRIDPSVPVAAVSRTTAFAVTTAESQRLITYETVEVDTDNMVDLEESAFYIIPNRNGTYVVTGSVAVTGGGAAGNLVELELVTRFDATGTIPLATEQFRSPGSGGYYLRAMAMDNWSGVTNSKFGYGMVFQTGLVDASILRADLSAYWVSDRVTN